MWAEFENAKLKWRTIHFFTFVITVILFVRRGVRYTVHKQPTK